MDIQERIEKEKELYEQMRITCKLAITVAILTASLIISNAVWLICFSY